MGPFHLQPVLELHAPEHVLRERITGHVAHVKLQHHAVAGTAGDGLVARLQPGNPQGHVLTGQELQGLRAGRAQVQFHHVLAQPVQAADPGLDALHRDVRHAPDLEYLEHDVGARRVHAHEKLPLGLLLFGEAEIVRGQRLDAAIEQTRTTDATGAVGAAVGQVEAGPQSGLEHALPFLDGKTAPRGFDPCMVFAGHHSNRQAS